MERVWFQVVAIAAIAGKGVIVVEEIEVEQEL
jgi:hypothetical protein